MALWTLPPELARLVRAFLTLEDLVAVTGSCATSHSRLALLRLGHFLPTVEQLHAYVPQTKHCLRSDRRRAWHPHNIRSSSTSSTSCTTVASVVVRPGPDLYSSHGCLLRWLLLHCDRYTTLAASKLDAYTALVCDRPDVALEILEAQKRRRRLNRFTLARTLALALRRSSHTVVNWISQQFQPRSLDWLPANKRLDVALAWCEYPDEDADGELSRQLLPRSLDFSSRHDCQKSLLVAASRFGKLAIVRSLLADMALAAVAEVLEEATAAAAERGHEQIIHTLLQLHRTSATEVLQALDATQSVVLACRHGHAAVVQTLLNSLHCRFKTPLVTDMSPLLAAVVGSSLDVLQLVIHDPRVNDWDPRAVPQAVCDGHDAMVQELLAHPQCTTKDLELALRAFVAAQPTLAAPCEMSSSCGITTKILPQLLTKLHAADSGSCWELLDLVCSYGSVALMELLLAKIQVEPDDACHGRTGSSDRKYWRPLVTAARHGHADIVHLILAARGVWKPLGLHHSIDADAEAAEALLAACHRGHVAAAQQLRPLVSVEMMQLLRVVEAAAAAPTSCVLKWLLDSQSRVAMVPDTSNSHSSTTTSYDLDAALQYACAHGRTASARLLLAHPHVRFTDGLPLQFAATSGELALVDLLLNDPRVDATYDLEAALVDAAREGHVGVVARLLEDTRLRITSGVALHEAAYHGRPRVLEMLLAHPHDLAMELLDLELAYTKAAQRGHYAVVFVLLRDQRVRLPRDGALTRVQDLPRQVGDATWSRSFLRRFLRHVRVDPTAESHALLLDACLLGERGVVDALLRSGRVRVSETIVETVDDLARLADTGAASYSRQRHVRRYKALAQDLRRYMSSELSRAATRTQRWRTRERESK